MKNGVLISAFLLIVIIFFSLRPLQLRKAAPEVKDKMVEKVSLGIDPVLKTKVIVNSQKEIREYKVLPKTDDRAGKEIAKQNLVHFQVVGGVAVFSGDVILGSLRDGDQLRNSNGLTEAPKVQYWTQKEIPYQIQEDVPRPDEVRAAGGFGCRIAPQPVAADSR